AISWCPRALRAACPIAGCWIRPIYIGIKNDSIDSPIICLITTEKSDIFNFDSIPNLSSEIISNKNITINKVAIDNKLYYSATKDSTLFVSNRLAYTQGFLKSKGNEHKALDYFEAANPDDIVSIFSDKAINPFERNKDSVLKDIPFSKNTLVDINIQQNDIFISGVTEADSAQTLINGFKGSVPQENLMASVCPSSISNFVSITSNDFMLIKQRFDSILKKEALTDFKLLHNSSEYGQAQIDNKKVLIYRPVDISMALEELETEEIEDIYRTVEIYKLKNTETASLGHLGLLESISSNYYITLNGIMIFAESDNVLKTFISNYQNGNTLTNSEAYQNLMLNLSDEASIFVFDNPNSLKNRLQTAFDEQNEINTSPYKTSAIQFIYESDFAHINGAYKSFNQVKTKGEIAEELALSLDAAILNDPQFLKNHKTGEFDIAVQDINNNLYLLSNKGKVYWKKQISGAILGEIKQIDSYKNGRLQMVFSTDSSVFILDRNGNELSPFPLKFNDEITQPVSVFDYDKNYNYRILVTQGKNLLLYNKSGKPVSGFKFDKSNDRIDTQPKHFRINGKDYIVFRQGAKLKIISRTGKTRVPVDKDILFSKNDIYLYKNSFTTTNTNGELLQVKTNGRINSTNLNLKENHKITTTTKTLAALSENELTIKSKTIELDYGNYTEPKIFYLNDKIYVSITDLQHKKVYLFDSQAKPISGFPVYGNSTIDIRDVDNDSNLEIMTTGDANAIIVYQIN
ncbi:MAG: ribonuclease HII, partial [Bacteroidota bacterium]